jgi:hypothetical protein
LFYNAELEVVGSQILPNGEGSGDDNMGGMMKETVTKKKTLLRGGIHGWGITFGCLTGKRLF